MRYRESALFCEICGLPQGSLPQQAKTCPGPSNPRHDQQAGTVHFRVAAMVARNDRWFKHKPKRKRG